jgi:hypothetical protein
VPNAKGLFQDVIQDVDANTEELLNRMPIPSHLLFLVHSLGHNLVASRFGEAGRYAESGTERLP